MTASHPPSSSTVPTDADLTSVVGGLLARAAADEIEAFEAVSDSPAAEQALAALRADDLTGVRYPLAHRMQEVLRGLARTVHPQDSLAQFVVVHMDFVEGQLKRLFREVEGHACSSDKTRWVLRSYLRHARTGAPIVVDRTQSHTYHLPKQVLCEQNDIVAFLAATMALFYGEVDRFVELRAALTQKVPADAG